MKQLQLGGQKIPQIRIRGTQRRTEGEDQITGIWHENGQNSRKNRKKSGIGDYQEAPERADAGTVRDTKDKDSKSEGNERSERLSGKAEAIKDRQRRFKMGKTGGRDWNKGTEQIFNDNARKFSWSRLTFYWKGVTFTWDNWYKMINSFHDGAVLCLFVCF